MSSLWDNSKKNPFEKRKGFSLYAKHERYVRHFIVTLIYVSLKKGKRGSKNTNPDR